MTLPQTLNPGTEPAFISWAPVLGRGAIVPTGVSGITVTVTTEHLLRPVLSELSPGCNWGSQRCVCPRCGHTSQLADAGVLRGARGVGEPGELSRTRPFPTLALREALGSGPGPAFSRYGQRPLLPEPQFAGLQIGDGDGIHLITRGNRAQRRPAHAAAVSTVTMVTASSYHEYRKWGCGPARPPPLALSPL